MILDCKLESGDVKEITKQLEDLQNFIVENNCCVWITARIYKNVEFSKITFEDKK